MAFKKEPGVIVYVLVALLLLILRILISGMCQALNDF